MGFAPASRSLRTFCRSDAPPFRTDSLALALPTPSGLPESALSAFPVGATLRGVPHPGDPGRNVYPLLHPLAFGSLKSPITIGSAATNVVTHVHSARA
jgi:hypothetical protein